MTQITSSISLRVAMRREPVVLPPLPSLWYAPSDRYRVNYNTGDMRYNPNGDGPIRTVVTANSKPYPAAYRVKPDQAFPVPQAFLNLLAAINPKLSYDRAVSLLIKGMVYCNTNDFQIDAVRYTSGATFEGQRDGDRVWLKSYGIHDPVPTVGEVLWSHCWFWSTSIGTDGKPHLITRVGLDGQRYGVRMILMSETPLWLSADNLIPVTAVMDPLWK